MYLALFLTYYSNLFQTRFSSKESWTLSGVLEWEAQQWGLESNSIWMSAGSPFLICTSPWETAGTKTCVLEKYIWVRCSMFGTKPDRENWQRRKLPFFVWQKIQRSKSWIWCWKQAMDHMSHEKLKQLPFTNWTRGINNGINTKQGYKFTG